MNAPVKWKPVPAIPAEVFAELQAVFNRQLTPVDDDQLRLFEEENEDDAGSR